MSKERLCGVCGEATATSQASAPDNQVEPGLYIHTEHMSVYYEVHQDMHMLWLQIWNLNIWAIATFSRCLQVIRLQTVAKDMAIPCTPTSMHSISPWAAMPAQIPQRVALIV